MPAPIVTLASAIAKAAAKKLAFDFLTDPSKILKFILIMFGIIISICLLFIAPIYLLTNLPVVFITDINNEQLTQKQVDIISKYQAAADDTYSRYQEWGNSKKREYSSADDIQISFDINFTWHELISIDSVLRNQDFSNVNKNDIKLLADKFIYTHSYTENYTVVEKYTDVIEVTEYVDVVDPSTGIKTSQPVKKYRTVEREREVKKTRAVIKVNTRTFSDVLSILGFSEEDKQIASQILSNVSSIKGVANYNG